MNEREHDTEDSERPPETGDTGAPSEAPRENGGPRGPEPTRYGDWERNGRCYDF
jgi:hypothetical protein